ncbi:hypothetical protein GCM10010270_28930 [Streptomyces violaceus]|nr:hypothetical protein GCM10010270_28930 [Streptomyces janthinus]
MPLVGADAFVAVDGQDLGLAFDGGHGGVCGGEFAEEGGEAELAGVVEVLVAEDEGLVAQEAAEYGHVDPLLAQGLLGVDRQDDQGLCLVAVRLGQAAPLEVDVEHGLGVGSEDVHPDFFADEVAGRVKRAVHNRRRAGPVMVTQGGRTGGARR